MVEGLSRREAAKRFGVHRNTITKMLQYTNFHLAIGGANGSCRRSFVHAVAWIDKILERPERAQKTAPYGAADFRTPAR